jgi:hypothetical protein
MAKKKEWYITQKGIRYHYTHWPSFKDGEYVAFDLKPSGWRAIVRCVSIRHSYYKGSQCKHETYDLVVTLKEVLENTPDYFRNDILRIQEEMISKTDTKINRQEKQMHKREDELEEVL